MKKKLLFLILTLVMVPLLVPAFELPAAAVTTHSYDNEQDLDYTPGDVDGVEGVTLDDAIYALFAINFPEAYALNQPIDFDGNGKIDLDDAIYLLFHVNFPDTYPLQTPSTDNTECQHAFGEWEITKQATCNEEGELVRTCSKCSHSEKTTIAKNNVHVEVIDSAVAATCTETGLTEGKHCSRCNTTLVAQSTTQTINHIEGDWIVDTAVSLTEDGYRHKECTYCELILLEEVLYAGSQGMEYTLLEDGTYAVSGRGSCQDTIVHIPRAYQDVPVTRIEYYAFRYI